VAENYGHAAGIGGGLNAAAGTIVIHGGAVEGRCYWGEWEDAFSGIIGSQYGYADWGFGGAGIGNGGATGHNKKISALFLIPDYWFMDLRVAGGGQWNQRIEIGVYAFFRRGSVTIDGGRVSATGGQDAAGIGGSAKGNVDTVTISGAAKVTALSGWTFWGGHCYAVGPGHFDRDSSDNSRWNGTVTVAGKSEDDLRRGPHNKYRFVYDNGDPGLRHSVSVNGGF